MNITNDIIHDLFPLYLANECSADTRALVEEYLKQNPRQAEQLRRIMEAPVPGAVPPAKGLMEAESFREARRRLRRRSWLMALAICFSLAPFSFVYSNGKTWFVLRDAPMSALVYGAFAVALWIAFAVNRKQSNSL